MRRVFILIGLLSNAARGEVSLSLKNWKKPPTSLVAALPVKSKAHYFKALEAALGVSAGLQNSSSGLCPTMTNGAPVAVPSCLRDVGIGYVVLIGDSLTREVGWSLSRMAASSSTDACQKFGGEHGHARWSSIADPEHRNPSFTCQVHAPGICSASEQVLPTGYGEETDDVDVNSPDFAAECCKPGQFTMYYHKHNALGDNSRQLIEKYNSRCKCQGLLWLGTGMHHLLGNCGGELDWLTRAGENNEVPGMFPFGRSEGLRPLFQAAANASNLHVVFSSTPKVSLDIFMLAPPKYDWAQFRQFDTLDLWAENDRLLAQETGVLYAPYFEASQVYKGLQCDGMHFSPRYFGDVCKGFTVVTDLVVHQALSQVCYGISPFIT
jgi:hypothetical protein